MQPNVYTINVTKKERVPVQTQISNLTYASEVGRIVNSSLGPHAMQKLIIVPSRGVTLTSDGNAIVRELNASHPATRLVVDTCRTQDESVGDGTTSVLILSSELFEACKYCLSRIHPVALIALLDLCHLRCIQALNSIALPSGDTYSTVLSTLSGKCVPDHELLAKLAIDAVNRVGAQNVRRCVRIEKIPGDFSSSEIVSGVVLSKDLLHPRMRRRIEKARIVLLDTSLEYEKGESKITVEITEDGGYEKALNSEETRVIRLCQLIMSVKPDIVVTEKGMSDAAVQFFAKENVTAFRRVRKSDTERLARATGGTVIAQLETLSASHVGRCGLFELRILGNDYFSYFTECDGKACTIVLRGTGKDTLNEIERSLEDALSVARSAMMDPRIVPGGGAAEMSASSAIRELAGEIERTMTACDTPQKGKERSEMKDLVKRFIASIDSFNPACIERIARVFEVVPRTLITNSGADLHSLLEELRELRRENKFIGYDANARKVVDVRSVVMESYLVKKQVFDLMFEQARSLVKIDSLLPGKAKK